MGIGTSGRFNLGSVPPAGSEWASEPLAATTEVISAPAGSTSALGPPAGSAWASGPLAATRYEDY